LARREHSQLELARKLRQKGFGDDAVRGIVDELVQEGLLSNVRFAESYVRMRLDRGYGPLRVTAELRQRGVAGEWVTELLAQFDVDWIERAATVRRKHFGAALPHDLAELARQSRFLQHRGFTQEQIHAVLAAARGHDRLSNEDDC
jgi:regulatory protein